MLLTRALAVVALVAACQNADQGVQPNDGDLVPALHARAADIAAWHADDSLEGNWLSSPTLSAPEGATRIAAVVRTTGPAGELTLMARGDDGPWQPMTTTWREATRRVVRLDFGAVVHSVQVAIADDDAMLITGISFEAVVPMVQQPRAAIDIEAHQSSHAVLDGYQPRSSWGARAENGCGDDGQSKNRITVHHTVSNLNDGSIEEQQSEVRSAQALHMDGRGYCDIGYHFLVGADGTIYEGRRAARLGAHTGGQNGGNLGISFLGCFHPTSDCDGLGSTTPPQVMLDGAGAFIGTAMEHYGITLNFGTTFFGHRDNPGQSTACPGDNLHDRLDDLQAIAEGGAPPVATTGRVQGSVWNLSLSADVAGAGAAGAFLPDAVVSTNTGVTAVARADDAYWSLDLPPGSYTLTATAVGFEPASRTITIAAGDALWSSLGVVAQQQAVATTITVIDAVTQAPLPGASVVVAGAMSTADANGALTTILPPGAITITASAEGYDPRTITTTAVLGTPLVVVVELTLTTINPDPTPDPTPDPELPPVEEQRVRRVVIRNDGGPTASGGCDCSAQPSVAVWAIGLVLLRRRRR